MINKGLAKKRGLSQAQIEVIESLQKNRDEIEARMKKLNPKKNKETLLELLEEWRENEYKLQDAWMFRRDCRMHKEFFIPHCSCPKIDNEDCIGTDMRYINPKCIYHGQTKWKGGRED